MDLTSSKGHKISVYGFFNDEIWFHLRMTHTYGLKSSLENKIDIPCVLQTEVKNPWIQNFKMGLIYQSPGFQIEFLIPFILSPKELKIMLNWFSS